MERVYKITINEYYYYGSTKTSIKERMKTHHCDSIRSDSKLYKKVREIGWDKVQIEIIKECENSRKEEDILISVSLKDPFCLNTNRASPIDMKDYQKEFYKANKEHIQDYQKEFYKANKVRLSAEKKAKYHARILNP
jgi:hypothetical protein